MWKDFSDGPDAGGFALMKLPEGLNTAYERSWPQDESRQWLIKLRNMLTNVRPETYRGIRRCPLREDPEAEPGWEGNAEHYKELDDRDIAARTRLLDLIGASDPDHYSPDRYLLPTLEYAQELLALVDVPSDYEIVRVLRAAERDRCTVESDLGFDIGYWEGESYSVICDSAIWPRWHGPDEDAFPEVAKRLANLNQHCLFNSYDEAQQFRAWYRRQKWAETEGEPDEFCIIKVGAVCAK